MKTRVTIYTAFCLIFITAGYSQNIPAQKKQVLKPVVDPDKQKIAQPTNARSAALFAPFDYNAFLAKEKKGEFPPQGGAVPRRESSHNFAKKNYSLTSTTDALTNNNTGSSGTTYFTQSEATVSAFGSTIVVGYNDAGSNAVGTNKFTGYSYSTDGGATFTDGGSLPTNAGGDAGDPVLARNETTGRIYLVTLGFSISTAQVFHSDDNGVTWSAPVNGTPGGSSEDKDWITVDNYAGSGNGNVYLVSRNFGAGNGIYMYRSTDNGATFGPSSGLLIVSGSQGAFVAIGPDHSVYAFWFAGSTIQMRKSTDLGLTFGAPVTVASGLVGGVNGDLGLTGLRQGTSTFSSFRSNEFPHAAVNPVSGNVYVTYANDGIGADKADVFLVQSSNGGANWSAAVKVNDDVTTTDQWQPTLAVTPDGSHLGVFYYSRQEDPATNNLFKYYGRQATISGSSITFSPSFAISDVASLPEFGRDAVVNSVYMGDYNNAVATASAFHVVWSDNRDDLAGGAPRKDPNVYYQSIPVCTSPIVACPSNISVSTSNLTCDASVPFAATATGTPTPSIDYAIGSTPITSPYTFSKGTTTVTATATNNCGTNSCTFTVTVTDNTNPVITCPSNISVSPTSLAGAVVTYVAPVGTDNCPAPTTIQTTGLPSGSTFPIGTTTNTFLVTDASTNTAVCSFTVTVSDPSCGPSKVLVCHHGSTICVNTVSLQAHLNHGDQLGPCPQNKRGGEAAGIPEEYSLEQNYPNPFGEATFAGNPKTMITYAVPENGAVQLRVLDSYGRIVSELENGMKAAGTYTAAFDASSLPSGIYFYKLSTDSKTIVKKMIYTK